MPIDWDAFDRDVDAALARAGARTDAALAARVAAVSKLTEAEVLSMFPEAGDVDRVRRLMLIVNSAEDQNRKISRIITDIEDLAGVVVTLLGKVA